MKLMLQSRYIVLVFGLLFLFSCNRKTKRAVVDEPMIVEEEVMKEAESVEIDTEVEDEEEEVYVICELRRTSCYGKCPAYTVKLFSDGRAEYIGKANVERIGAYVAYVNPQDFESIFEAAAVANYFVLRNQYPTDGQKLSDLPSTITYLKRNGLENRVIDNFDAPANLVKFEEWLDAFFLDLEWEDEKR